MDFRHYNQQFKKKSKKWPLILIAIVALTAVLFGTVFFAQTTGDGESYRTISVVEVSGKVSVVKDGIEYRAYPGMLLQEGHELITSSNSYVRLVLDDDKYIKLEAGSRVVFETLGVLGSGKTSIRLERGSLISELVKPLKEGEQFVVNAPNAVLAVRGTFFRIDLTIAEKGDIKADVMTYGGQVASQRILPTGETVEEEVLISAGYKTSINMTQEDTHYVLEDENGEIIVIDPAPTDKPDDGGSEGDENVDTPPAISITQPITTEDIPTEDLIDVYFAAENGHELFVTAEEVKTDLEERNVVIEEQQSIYEKVEEVKKEQEAAAPSAGISNTTSASIKADDSQPIAKVEEPKPEEDNAQTGSNNSIANNDTGSTGLVDGEHVHREKRSTTAATCTTAGKVVVTCRDCKEVLETKEIPFGGHTYGDWVITQQATCQADGLQESSCSTCGEKLTATIAKHEHTEVNIASAEVHSKCSECGEILSTAHTMVNSSYVAPSCTEAGSNTYACDCGYTYTTEVAKLGHIEVAGATADVHSKCSTCNEVFSKTHEYVVKETATATCVKAGETTHTCACGYAYTTVNPMTGHTAINGGTVDVHSKCSTCNEVLSTTHNYVEEIISTSTCVSVGKVTYTCSCGTSYSGQIATKPHSYEEMIDAPTDTANGRSYSKCSMCGDEKDESLIVALNATNFPDENFRAYLDNAYNRDGQSGLTESEIRLITTLNLSGEGFDGEINVDGGIYDLTGIEYLTELVNLHVGYNSNLTELDVSANTKLQQLNAPSTNITKLDLSNNAALVAIDVNHCFNLTEINLSGTSMQTANIAYTGVTELSTTPGEGCLVVPETATITSLNINSTNINYETATDEEFAWFGALEFLNVSSGNLLDAELSKIVSHLPESLVTLDISYNDELTTVNVSNLTSLETLNMEGWIQLANIDMSNTKIAEFDVNLFHSLMSSLEYLNVSNTPMQELVIHSLSNVKEIQASNCSQLWRVSVQGLGGLSRMDISNSAVTTLEAIYCTSLGTINWENCDELESVSMTFVKMANMSLAGLGNVSKLEIMSSTDVESLDLTPCMNLRELSLEMCSNLRSVDASTCHYLEKLSISSTAISRIDMWSGNEAFVISSTAQIKDLNISGSGIRFSSFMPEELTWMGTVEKMTAMSVEMSDYDLQQMLSALTGGIKELDVSYNNDITSIDLSYKPSLTSLNVDYCQSLQTMNLSGTQLESLELNGLPSLTVVTASSLPLKSVTVTDSTIRDMLNLNESRQLETIESTGSTFGGIALENSTALHTISLPGCGTNDVNFAGCSGLVTLDLRDTPTTYMWIEGSQFPNLTTLNLSNCPDLETLGVRECTALVSVDITGSDAITNFDTIDSRFDESTDTLTFYVTSLDTYDTTSIYGWNDAHMVMVVAE